jgi:hypothetical protein
MGITVRRWIGIAVGPLGLTALALPVALVASIASMLLSQGGGCMFLQRDLPPKLLGLFAAGLVGLLASYRLLRRP